MAESTTEIANMALSHLATSKAISDVVDERSAEANACRMFIDQSRKEILRLRWWPFAGKLTTLALVQRFRVTLTPTPGVPYAEWKFAYRYPADCLDFRRIPSGIAHGADNRQTRIPYRIMGDDQGRLIYTDMCSALGEYTYDIRDMSFMPDDFCAAWAYRLASYIAPRVTAGDPFQLGKTALSLYQLALNTAASASFDEEQPDLPAESEFMRAREDITGQSPLQDPFASSSIIRDNS